MNITTPGVYQLGDHLMTERVRVLCPDVTLGWGRLNGGGSVDLAIQVTNVPRVHVVHLELVGYRRSGPYFGESSSDGVTDRDCSVEDSYIHDILGDPYGIGIQAWGKRFSILRTIVERCESDGINITGDYPLIEDVSVRDPSYNGGGTGDCVQINQARNPVLRRTVLDHNRNSDKQALVISGTGIAQLEGVVISAGPLTGAGAATLVGNIKGIRHNCTMLAPGGWATLNGAAWL